LAHRPVSRVRYSQAGGDELRLTRLKGQRVNMPFAIVEPYLEHPGVSWQQRGISRLALRVAVGGAVAVLDALEVAVGGTRSVAFVGLCEFKALLVLLDILVYDGVALVVVTLSV